jgi:hypothetical protein
MKPHDPQPADEAVRRALAADRAPLPQPLWPLIRDRLPPAMRRTSPRVRIAFAMGAALAAFAGLFLGAQLGAGYGRVGETPQATWTEMESVFSDSSATTLGDIYFAVAMNGTQEPR